MINLMYEYLWATDASLRSKVSSGAVEAGSQSLRNKTASLEEQVENHGFIIPYTALQTRSEPLNPLN